LQDVCARTRALGWRHAVLAVFFWLTLATQSAFADVSYVYDDLGRIVQATYSDGAVIVYQYDANGSIRAINRFAGSALAISALLPSITYAGASISIQGIGFSAVTTDNSVTIGGVPAVVTAATSTALTVIVPATANSGSVTVTVGGDTAVSPHSITVLRPSITAFSPARVSPGATVTITGTNLNVVPGTASITVGGVTASILSITSSFITFVAPAASGHIKLLTSYGEATSATSLIVVPNAVGAGNVVAFSNIAPAGSSVSLNMNQANKYGVLAFEGAAGSYLTLQLSSLVTVPSGSTVNYKVYTPTHAQWASGSISASSPSKHLQPLPSSGTYLVTFTSSGTVQIETSLEADTEVAVTGTPLTVSTAILRQSKRFFFSATAGQSVGLGIRNFTLTPNSNPMYLNVYKPDGSLLVTNTQCYTSAGGCQSTLRDLPATGTYSFTTTPSGASTTNFRLTLSPPVTGSLAPDTPQSVTLGEGQFTLLDFTVTAGQTVALYVGTVVTAPAARDVYTYVLGPTGATVANTSNNDGQMTLNMPNLAAGTYRVHIVPRDGVPATMQVTLASGIASLRPVDGAGTTFATTAPEQIAYFTFNGTAGQNVGIGIRNLTFTNGGYLAYVDVFKPDGTELGSRLQCTSSPGGCQRALLNLPATGTYGLRITPSNSARSMMAFRLTLSDAVTGTLAMDTPQSAALVEGQFTLLNFTASEGQTVAVNVGSVVTTPAGKITHTYVLNSVGETVLSTNSNTGTMTLNLTNLAADTYSVQVVPQHGIPATMQVTVASGLTGLRPVDSSGTEFATAVPEQIAYFTFNATAGQDIGIGIRNLVLDNGGYLVYVNVHKPDGGVLVSQFQCTESPGGCERSLINLPATGTYRLSITPSNSAQARMSFRLTLSDAVAGNMAYDTPQPVSLVEGQFTLLNFTATAGQTVAVNVTSTTVPAGRVTYVAVLNSSGTTVTSTNGSTGTLTLNLPNLAADTYSVYAIPRYGYPATMEVNVASGLAGAIPVDGTSATFSATVPEQIAYFTFSGVVGQNVGIGVRDLVLDNGGYLTYLNVYKPDGGTLGSQLQCNESDGGCQRALLNLPATGTYKVTITPSNSAQARMSFRLTLSTAITDAMTFNTPQSVSLVEGQFTLLPFTIAATQTVAVNVGSVVTTPTGRTTYTYVLNAAGATVASTNSNSGSMALNMPNLAAGTYSVHVVPRYGVPATMQVTVQ
jgi:YD repeat-containing protein